MEHKDVEITDYSYYDDEVMIVPGASLLVNFEPRRDKTVMGTYHAGEAQHTIVFWGENNALPEEREYIIGKNNIVPQIIRTKRDLIIGGGIMAYTYTTQKQVQQAFKKWAVDNGLSLRLCASGDFLCDTRCAFVDFVDSLQKSGEISAALADRVYLK